jgi:hypothetical protein
MDCGCSKSSKGLYMFYYLFTITVEIRILSEPFLCTAIYKVFTTPIFIV